MMVLSSVIVLIAYNRSDLQHPMTPAARRAFTCLGRLWCNAGTFRNHIAPMLLQEDHLQKDALKKAELQRKEEDAQESRDPAKPEAPATRPAQRLRLECSCWKHVAVILDQTFLVVYTFLVLLIGSVFAILLHHHEVPMRHCQNATEAV